MLTPRDRRSDRRPALPQDGHLVSLSQLSPRGRYLYGAASIAVRRQPAQPGLPYIGAKVKLDEVAAALGMSRTALYRRWETQHDFWMDLSRYLVTAQDSLTRSEDLPWRAVSVPPLDLERLAEVLEALRVGVGDIQARLGADLRVLVRASLFAYDDVPEIVAARRAAEQHRIEMLAALLFGLVDGMDHRFAAPLDAFGAATALWCLGDGLTVRAWRQPAVADEVIIIDDGNGPKPWTLLAYGARALLLERVVPGRLPPGDPTGTAGPAGPASHRRPSPPWNIAQLEALEAARTLFLDRVDPAQPAVPDHEISALRQVSVASVARECRVSRRAVYNLWASSDDLRLDLLTALLGAERKAIARRLEPVLTRPLGPDHLAAQVVSSLVHRPAEQQLWVGHVRLAYLVDGRNPEVQARNAAGTAEILDTYRSAVGRIWPAAERPSGQALGDRQLAELLSCVADGANRLMRVLPEALAGQAPGVGLSALVEALVAHDPGAVDLVR